MMKKKELSILLVFSKTLIFLSLDIMKKKSIILYNTIKILQL